MLLLAPKASLETQPIWLVTSAPTGIATGGITGPGSPQTNGICERFHRTMQDEFYSVAFRKKLYSSLEQLQADLHDWPNEYNEHRSHSGKHCFGKTPLRTFLDSLHLAHEKEFDRLAVVTSPDSARRSAPAVS